MVGRPAASAINETTVDGIRYRLMDCPTVWTVLYDGEEFLLNNKGLKKQLICRNIFYRRDAALKSADRLNSLFNTELFSIQLMTVRK